MVSDLVKQPSSTDSFHSRAPRQGVNSSIRCGVWCRRRCRRSNATRLLCLCTESPVQEFVSLPIFFLCRGLTHYIDYRAPPTIHDYRSAICYARWIGMNTWRRLVGRSISCKLCAGYFVLESFFTKKCSDWLDYSKYVLLLHHHHCQPCAPCRTRKASHFAFVS